MGIPKIAQVYFLFLEMFILLMGSLMEHGRVEQSLKRGS